MTRETAAMDLPESLERMLRYDRWANGEALASLRASGTPPAKALRWMAHVLATERLWWGRLRKDPRQFPVWPELELEECDALQAELSGMWRSYLGALAEPDFTRPVPYRNSRGEPWSSTPEDVLLHVVLHSAHHRGQIASELRAAGLAPATTDFVHAVRTGQLGDRG